MKLLKEERGNITLFTIGAMFIVMLMFIFTINLAKVFAVKEQASTSTQQASLAATAVLYEQVWDAIDDYERTLLGSVTSLPMTTRERVDEQTRHLQNSHPSWSFNEAYVEAIDQVLSDELKHGLGKAQLKRALMNKLNPDVIYAMKEKARETILANGGTLDGAEIRLFDDNRVYVRAATKMKSIDYGSFFSGFEDDVFQTGAGPKIDFLDELGWIDRTESLE